MKENKHPYISAVMALWRKISDVTTFRGLVLVAVVAGIILLCISSVFPSTQTPEPDKPSPSNTTTYEEDTDNPISTET